MDRRTRLLNLCEDEATKEMAANLVDELLFLEKQLEEIKQHPFYQVSTKNRFQQRALPVGKLYRELLQQYTNGLKLLRTISGKSDGIEDNLLFDWLKEMREQNNVSYREKDMDAG